MRRLISTGQHVFLPIAGTFENPLFDHLEDSKSQQLWIEIFNLICQKAMLYLQITGISQIYFAKSSCIR